MTADFSVENVSAMDALNGVVALACEDSSVKLVARSGAVVTVRPASVKSGATEPERALLLFLAPGHEAKRRPPCLAVLFSTYIEIYRFGAPDASSSDDLPPTPVATPVLLPGQAKLTCACLPGKRFLFVGTSLGTVVVLNLVEQRWCTYEVACLASRKSPVTSLMMKPKDESQLLIAYGTGELFTYHTNTRKLHRKYEQASTEAEGSVRGPIRSAVWDPSGEWIAAGFQNGDLLVWRRKTNTAPAQTCSLVASELKSSSCAALSRRPLTSLHWPLRDALLVLGGNEDSEKGGLWLLRRMPSGLLAPSEHLLPTAPRASLRVTPVLWRGPSSNNAAAQLATLQSTSATATQAAGAPVQPAPVPPPGLALLTAVGKAAPAWLYPRSLAHNLKAPTTAQPLLPRIGRNSGSSPVSCVHLCALPSPTLLLPARKTLAELAALQASSITKPIWPLSLPRHASSSPSPGATGQPRLLLTGHADSSFQLWDASHLDRLSALGKLELSTLVQAAHAGSLLLDLNEVLPALDAKQASAAPSGPSPPSLLASSSSALSRNDSGGSEPTAKRGASFLGKIRGYSRSSSGKSGMSSPPPLAVAATPFPVARLDDSVEQSHEEQGQEQQERMEGTSSAAKVYLGMAGGEEAVSPTSSSPLSPTSPTYPAAGSVLLTRADATASVVAPSTLPEPTGPLEFMRASFVSAVSGAGVRLVLADQSYLMLCKLSQTDCRSSATPAFPGSGGLSALQISRGFVLPAKSRLACIELAETADRVAIADKQGRLFLVQVSSGRVLLSQQLVSPVLTLHFSNQCFLSGQSIRLLYVGCEDGSWLSFRAGDGSKCSDLVLPLQSIKEKLLGSMTLKRGQGPSLPNSGPIKLIQTVDANGCPRHDDTDAQTLLTAESSSPQSVLDAAPSNPTVSASSTSPPSPQLASSSLSSSASSAADPTQPAQPAEQGQQASSNNNSYLVVAAGTTLALLNCQIAPTTTAKPNSPTTPALPLALAQVELAAGLLCARVVSAPSLLLSDPEIPPAEAVSFPGYADPALWAEFNKRLVARRTPLSERLQCDCDFGLLLQGMMYNEEQVSCLLEMIGYSIANEPLLQDESPNKSVPSSAAPPSLSSSSSNKSWWQPPPQLVRKLREASGWCVVCLNQQGLLQAFSLPDLAPIGQWILKDLYRASNDNDDADDNDEEEEKKKEETTDAQPFSLQPETFSIAGDGSCLFQTRAARSLVRLALFADSCYGCYPCAGYDALRPCFSLGPVPPNAATTTPEKSPAPTPGKPNQNTGDGKSVLDQSSNWFSWVKQKVVELPSVVGGESLEQLLSELRTEVMFRPVESSDTSQTRTGAQAAHEKKKQHDQERVKLLEKYGKKQPDGTLDKTDQVRAAAASTQDVMGNNVNQARQNLDIARLVQDKSETLAQNAQNFAELARKMKEDNDKSWFGLF
eukprot:gb/GEZN01000402.1/.p1 GENE.gb/GEZN01000402.1/~~gb/GEZN01000402.1/.p1  ORF type:complete len:1472 (+),score=339.31 gb/GEZN01000402.1/:121-4416(+)